MDITHYNPNSKVWIFQLDRSLGELEADVLKEVNEFLSNWGTHGKLVEAVAEVVEGVFLVVISNEDAFPVSGCAIDSLTHFVQKIGNKYQIDFFDREKFYYRSGSEIGSCDYSALSLAMESGRINSDTLMYDSSVNTMKRYLNGWISPIKDSWLFLRFA